jgi:hypothetical protein
MLFSLFQHHGSHFFNIAASKDPRHVSRNSMYTFYVAKHGRMGGVDKRLFDVFYGARPYDNIVEVTSILRPPSRKKLVEDGGGLAYERSSSGFVSCILYPPHTRDFNSNDLAYILGLRLDPINMLSQTLIERHFRLYSACFECAGLDGEPSKADKMLYLFLVYFHARIEKGKYKRSLAIDHLLEITKFSLMIGLSGFLLKLIEIFF